MTGSEDFSSPRRLTHHGSRLSSFGPFSGRLAGS